MDKRYREAVLWLCNYAKKQEQPCGWDMYPAGEIRWGAAMNMGIDTTTEFGNSELEAMENLVEALKYFGS